MSPSVDPLNDPRFRDVMTRLRGQLPPTPPEDFTRAAMERIRRDIHSHNYHMSRWIQVAALLLILFAAGWFLVPKKIPAIAGTPSPVDILMAAQRDDGGWSADSLNRLSRYDTGVTALVLLALLQKDPAERTEEQISAIRNGAAHLVRQQTPDGRFGPDFSGWKFNQYLATKALEFAGRLEAADPLWRMAAERAKWHLPSEVQMARLNQHLARPEGFPSRWAEAGGEVAATAIQLLKR